jgi:hypothetical protein
LAVSAIQEIHWPPYNSAPAPFTPVTGTVTLTGDRSVTPRPGWMVPVTPLARAIVRLAIRAPI